MAELTHHAKRRMHDRIGISKGSAKKYATRVLREGIKHENTKGRLREWMDYEYLKYRTANNMRYYAGKLYIFRGEMLITVLNADSDMEKELSKLVDKSEYDRYKSQRKQRSGRKQMTQKERMEQEQAEIAENIFEALQEYVKRNHSGDIIITDVKFTRPKTVRLHYITGQTKNDWYRYTDIQMFIRDWFDVSSFFRKVKDLDGNCVTIEQWKKIKGESV